tara:strand:+ start:3951 stop:4787 length:837 start_codon:yes stop_codon:yes gene_type:complete
MSNLCRVFSFKIKPYQFGADILVAQLSEIGFYGFENIDHVLNAYVLESKWNPTLFNNIQILTNPDFSITYNSKLIKPMNWNKNWEKNFKPIRIDKKCGVRAKFHTPMNLKHEIIITPKMSFGTGHHETTSMVLLYLLHLNLRNLEVLDVGSGTGILSILCEKKGAKSVDAIDIDSSCVKNTKENALLNNCNIINSYCKDVNQIISNRYDLIVANINKNVVINNIIKFSNLLSRGGQLIISGFFLNDYDDIDNKASSVNFRLKSKKVKNKWLSIHYMKV